MSAALPAGLLAGAHHALDGCTELTPDEFATACVLAGKDEGFAYLLTTAPGKHLAAVVRAFLHHHALADQRQADADAEAHARHWMEMRALEMPLGVSEWPSRQAQCDR